MPASAPANTLAHHLARPLTSRVPFSHLQCSDVAEAVQEYMMSSHAASGNHPHPETDALLFYLSNHGMGLLRQEYDLFEPLREKDLHFVLNYYAMVSQLAIRAAHYLLIICIREARHGHSSATVDSKMTAMFGDEVVAFLRSGKSEDGIFQRFVKQPPATTFGQFTEALEWFFDHNPFSANYGGKAWGNVARCLRKFVSGEFSAEMMLDTNWTLAHNGGPIFNKGHLYKMYDLTKLGAILDVQRSGQIPELIREAHPLVKTFLTSKIIHMQEFIEQRWPGKIGPYCDFFKAEILGAITPMGLYQSQQVSKYGPSEYMSEAQKKADADKKALAAAAKKAAEDYEKNNLTVFKITGGMKLIVPKLNIVRPEEGQDHGA